MEKVIKKAQEYGFSHVDLDFLIKHELWGEITSKPSFWQALGKAEGWSDYGRHTMTGNNLRCSACGEKPHVVEFCRRNLASVWKYQWHMFIDHLAEGGNADDFFNNLLSK